MKWLRKHASVLGVLVVLGAAIALWVIPSNPSKPWWGVVLVALGPIAMWLTRQVERKGKDNENLIRQLGPIVKDAGDLEFTIRNFARDLLNKSEVKIELGEVLGTQGCSAYIESNGAWQLSAISSLKTDLKEADPFEQTQVINIVTSFHQILGRVLEVESRLVAVCQKINNLPQGAQSRWDYIQKAHQRLSTQLSGLKPTLNEIGRGDLFDTFVNQPPSGLRAEK